jgi:hypothetical protein
MDTVKRSLGLKAEQMALIERRRNQRAVGSRHSPNRHSNGHSHQSGDHNGSSGSGLANRRSHLKNRNLTIVTPSYGSTSNSIKSAPIGQSSSMHGSHTRSLVHPYDRPPGTSSSYHPSINATNLPAIPGHVPIARSSALGHAAPSHTTAGPTSASIIPPSLPHRSDIFTSSQQHSLHPAYVGAGRLPQQPRTAHPAGAGFNNHSLPSPILATSSPPHHHHTFGGAAAHYLPHTAGGGIGGGSSSSRQNFLGLFETFYDTLADSRVLHANLADQMRRSAALLTTLQQSATLSEARLDKRLGDMCQSLTRDLQLVEARIERLEKAFEKSSGSELPPLEKKRGGTEERERH